MPNQADSLKKVVIWILATVSAAVIGALLNSAWDSAHPDVSIIQVIPSLDANARFDMSKDEVPIPDKLRSIAVKTYWSNINYLRGQLVSYDQLVATLDDNEQRMKQLKRTFQAYQTDRKEMTTVLRLGQNASDDDILHFYDLWERNNAFVYGLLRGEFHRKRLQIEPFEYNGRPRLPIWQNEDDDWFITKPGGRYSCSLFCTKHGDRELQKEMAHALAYFNTERLTKYLKVVDSIKEEDVVAGELLQEIESVRKNVSRLTATISLSNSGKNPISFLAYAEITIETNGLVADGNTINNDTTFLLEHRDKNKQLTPILLSGGSSVLADFSTHDIVMNLNRSDLLLSVYKLGAKNCKVKLFAAGGGWFNRSTYESSWKKFASSKFVIDQKSP